MRTIHEAVLERPLENQSRYLLSAGSWREEWHMHTYQPSLQHVEFDVRFTSKKERKKEHFNLHYRRVFNGGWAGTEQGLENLLTLCLSSHCPRFFLPIIHPCLWSLNPNGRRLFHLIAKGAVGAPLQPHIPKSLCFCRNTHTSTSCNGKSSTHKQWPPHTNPHQPISLQL